MSNQNLMNCSTSFPWLYLNPWSSVWTPMDVDNRLFLATTATLTYWNACIISHFFFSPLNWKTRFLQPFHTSPTVLASNQWCYSGPSWKTFTAHKPTEGPFHVPDVTLAHLTRLLTFFFSSAHLNWHTHKLVLDCQSQNFFHRATV